MFKKFTHQKNIVFTVFFGAVFAYFFDDFQDLKR